MFGGGVFSASPPLSTSGITSSACDHHTFPSYLPSSGLPTTPAPSHNLPLTIGGTNGNLWHNKVGIKCSDWTGCLHQSEWMPYNCLSLDRSNNVLMYPVTSFHTCYRNFKCASGQTLSSLVLPWMDRNCNREAFLLLKRRTKGKKKKLRGSEVQSTCRFMKPFCICMRNFTLYMYKIYLFSYI